MAEPRVRIVPGGPMLVSWLALGRLRRGEDGWALDDAGVGAEDYALCRCGRSDAMPLCDRPAPYRCFEEEPASGPAPAPFRWDVPDPAGPPAIALKPDGPVRVAGEVTVTYGDRTLEGRDRLSLCRCGASRCQPLCDSSHKVVGYRG
jgi:CDGSH-type Zn-finger protein